MFRIPSELKMDEALRAVFSMLGKNEAVDKAREILLEYEKQVSPSIKDAGKYIGENPIVKISLDIHNNARLGKSVFAESIGANFDEYPTYTQEDLDNLINLVEDLIKNQLIIAYKVVNKGGIITALCEMAVLGGSGISAHMLSYNYFNQAFNEEVAIIVEIDRRKYDEFMSVVKKYYYRKSHPYPGSRACVPIEHFYFNIHRFALTQKKQIIDIWWSTKCSYNIEKSTSEIMQWYNNIAA
jgi:hypothetical protein